MGRGDAEWRLSRHQSGDGLATCRLRGPHGTKLARIMAGTRFLGAWPSPFDACCDPAVRVADHSTGLAVSDSGRSWSAPDRLWRLSPHPAKAPTCLGTDPAIATHALVFRGRNRSRRRPHARADLPWSLPLFRHGRRTPRGRCPDQFQFRHRLAGRLGPYTRAVRRGRRFCMVGLPVSRTEIHLAQLAQPRCDLGNEPRRDRRSFASIKLRGKATAAKVRAPQRPLRLSAGRIPATSSAAPAPPSALAALRSGPPSARTPRHGGASCPRRSACSASSRASGDV